MWFVVIGHDSPAAKELRPQHRPAHLAHLEPLLSGGKLVLAGAFTDGAGTLMILDAESLDEVWEVLARDPYLTNGVFSSVEVHPFVRGLPRP